MNKRPPRIEGGKYLGCPTCGDTELKITGEAHIEPDCIEITIRCRHCDARLTFVLSKAYSRFENLKEVEVYWARH